MRVHLWYLLKNTLNKKSKQLRKLQKGESMETVNLLSGAVDKAKIISSSETIEIQEPYQR
jgi:hypothetical protein